MDADGSTWRFDITRTNNLTGDEFPISVVVDGVEFSSTRMEESGSLAWLIGSQGHDSA